MESGKKNWLERKEAVVKFETLFDQAEAVLAVEGRDKAKTLLPGIYDGLGLKQKRQRRLENYMGLESKGGFNQRRIQCIKPPKETTFKCHRHYDCLWAKA